MGIRTKIEPSERSATDIQHSPRKRRMKQNKLYADRGEERTWEVPFVPPKRGGTQPTNWQRLVEPSASRDDDAPQVDENQGERPERQEQG